MTLLALILFGIGVLVALASSVWFLVVAFQRSVWWGLAVFFLPLANLVFLFCAWAEAKRPFLLGLGSVALFAVGFFALPKEQLQQGFASAAMRRAQMQAAKAAKSQEEAKPLSSPASVMLQARLVAMKAREADLLERKAALNPKDIAGARALAEEITRYNAELQPVLEQMKRPQMVAATQ